MRVSRKTTGYLECSDFLANAGCHKFRMYSGGVYQVTSGTLGFLLHEGRGQGTCKEESFPHGVQEGFPLGRYVLRTQRESSCPVIGKSGLFLALWLRRDQRIKRNHQSEGDHVLFI